MTYSIVAVDEKTGATGVAVQTHNFAVGHMVPFVKSGVGAIATQAFTNTKYGEHGLELLASSKSPEQTLQVLLAQDPQREVRQVGIINAKGESVGFTGSQCIPYAGHLCGPFYSIQVNLMRTAKVGLAMEAKFKSSNSTFALRLLEVLEAAEEEGGDLRGKQSASLVIVKGKTSGSVVDDRLAEFHIYDHQNPLAELRRLLRTQDAYNFFIKGYEAFQRGASVEGSRDYLEAQRILPDNAEIKFWHAVDMANVGQTQEAIHLLGDVFKLGSQWRELAGRLVDSGSLKLSKDKFCD